MVAHWLSAVDCCPRVPGSNLASTQLMADCHLQLCCRLRWYMDLGGYRGKKIRKDLRSTKTKVVLWVELKLGLFLHKKRTENSQNFVVGKSNFCENMFHQIVAKIRNFCKNMFSLPSCALRFDHILPKRHAFGRAKHEVARAGGFVSFGL